MPKQCWTCGKRVAVLSYPHYLIKCSNMVNAYVYPMNDGALCQNWSPVKTQSGHHRAEELLMHYRCGACDSWWSIGDPHRNQADTSTLFCPVCGHQSKVNDHHDEEIG